MTVGVAAQAVLEGMPDPRDLRLVEVDGQVLLTVGSRVIAGWAAGDAPMRNLAAVTLRGLGFSGLRVAEVLGLSEEYVSTLRGRARREGSAGVVPRRGRPPALGARELGRARRLRERGHSDVEIGRRLGVHPTTVGRALGARSRPTAPVLAQPPLTARTPPLDDDLPATGAQGSATPPTPDPAGKSEPRHHDDEQYDDEQYDDEQYDDEQHDDEQHDDEQHDDEQHDDDAGRVAGAAAGSAGSAGSARIERASVGSRYAGAMLLHAFWHRVDAAGVLGQACERGSGERRFDDLGLLTGTSMAFALGVSSVEGVKHLIGSQVGPLAGLAALPELRTLRPRLAALADRCDPLDLQARLAAAMLTADAPGLGVYFVDDHFVPYEGAKPVGKGWNTKRRHAQRGRDDTLVTDYHGRAVCFASGEPSGLSVTLPGALDQLRAILGADAKILLGFDRGGSYPKVFTACRDAGADWLTWRRGALADTTATPVRSFRVGPSGTTEMVVLADDPVEISGYGPARQLTLFEHDEFEHDEPVMQILTSDLTAPAAALLAWLRCRWRIENVFKYLTAHHGIDWLCDYRADTGPDTTPITNPARVAARKTLTAAQTELATAERALAQLLCSDQHHTTINKAIPAAETRIDRARDAVTTAKTDLKTHPAKLPANTLDPDATRARPRTGRRALQMVLRLLAFNAEYWLADRLNAYLQDPDEYRAITRNLLHLGGQLTYTPHTITITLDRPATGRLTRALALLLDEINTSPPRLPGDSRPITYQLIPS